MASFPNNNSYAIGAMHSTGEAQVNGETLAGMSGSNNSATNTTQHALQYYPHDFFDPKDGAPPKNAEAAKKLWAFRKNWPGPGIIDEEPPDGKKMLEEVYTVQNSLHKFVMDVYLDGAREMAEQWKVTIPSTNDFPVTEKDLQKALASLE